MKNAGGGGGYLSCTEGPQGICCDLPHHPLSNGSLQGTSTWLHFRTHPWMTYHGEGWLLGSWGRPKGLWQGYRLRELRGVVWAWPCSFSFNRLPALVPLKQPPLTSFGGRGRGFRGGKLSPEGGERAPAAQG